MLLHKVLPFFVFLDMPTQISASQVLLRAVVRRGQLALFWLLILDKVVGVSGCISMAMGRNALMPTPVRGVMDHFQPCINKESFVGGEVV
jgi:hypothetical protein